jgi:hypothetical protein
MKAREEMAHEIVIKFPEQHSIKFTDHLLENIWKKIE